MYYKVAPQTKARQSRKDNLYGSDTKSCLIMFKVVTSCQVVHAILKSLCKYGNHLTWKRWRLLGCSWGLSQAAESNFMLLDLDFYLFIYLILNQKERELWVLWASGFVDFRDLPVSNLFKCPGTCDCPALMKRYLFRGKLKLLRYKIIIKYLV